MSLSNDDVARIGEIVHSRVSDAMLEHFRDCPQAPAIRALFEKAEANGKQINGVAAGVTKLADAVEADKAADAAARKGLSRGFMIGLALSAAGGGGIGAMIAKLL